MPLLDAEVSEGVSGVGVGAVGGSIQENVCVRACVCVCVCVCVYVWLTSHSLLS